jgi:hypothetical protein
MFRRSSSGKLFFLGRETNSKENENRIKIKKIFGNCYKVYSPKIRVTHS